MSAADPSHWTGLWAEAFRVERAGVDLRAGVAGCIASCAPLAIGVATGHGAIGSIACFGGLNACLAVPRGPLRTRLGWGVGAALGCELAVIVTTLAQDSTVASVAVAFAWVFLAALLRTFGPAGGLTGFITSAMLVIIGGIPAGQLDTGERALWFAAGTALGTVLMVLAYGTEPEGGLERQAAHARAAAPLAGDTAGAPSGMAEHADDDKPAVTLAEAEAAEPPLRAVLAAGVRQYVACALHDAPLRAHAVRLAVMVAATTLLYRALGLQHGYWVPLTVLAVLQPDEHASRVRALQRGAGTLGGTALIALVTALTGAEWALIALQGIAAFALFSLFARGYFWLVVFLTPVALLTVSAVDYQGTAIALERAGWSTLGIVCGLGIGELVWQLAPHLPTGHRPWESTGAE